eukprot:2791222-Amphidinium_carterae.1
MLPPEVTKDGAERTTPNAGVMAVLVDDILEAGTPRHRSLIAQLLRKFKFGKHETLKTQDGCIFNGRRIKQAEDFSMKANTHDFIAAKLQLLKLRRERKRQLEQGVTEDERALMHIVLMKVMWAARQSHPQVLGTRVTLASRIPQACVCDLVELAKTVEHLKAKSTLEMHFHSTPVKDWSMVVLVDASPCNRKLEKAVGGLIIGLSSQQIHDGLESPFSVLATRESWRWKASLWCMLWPLLSM